MANQTVPLMGSTSVGHFAEAVKRMLKQDGMRVYSDKDNTSQANRKLLTEFGLKDGIMHKAARNRPLTDWEKRKNQLSEIRFIVEQGFGTLKRPLAFGRSSYFGLESVYAQAVLKMMCLNLKKAANMIELIDSGAIPRSAIQLQEAV